MQPNKRTQKQYFSRVDGLLLRKTRRGVTLYTGVTIRDEMLIHAVRVLHERTGKTPSKILQKFIEKAFAAGFTPEW